MGLISRVSSRTYRNMSERPNFSSENKSHFDTQVADPTNINDLNVPLESKLFDIGSNIAANPKEKGSDRLQNLKNLHEKCNKLKTQISEFLTRLDQFSHSVDYEATLNNFNVINSELNGIFRLLESDKNSFLAKSVLCPIQVLNDVDPNLKNLTDNRVPFFNHDVIPDMLRTKLDREIEENNDKIAQEAFLKYCNFNIKNDQNNQMGGMNQFGQKQQQEVDVLDINNYENLEITVTNMKKIIKKCKDKIEQSINNYNSNNDLNSNKHKLNKDVKPEHTYQLINIYRHGLGLVNNQAPVSNHGNVGTNESGSGKK